MTRSLLTGTPGSFSLGRRREGSQRRFQLFLPPKFHDSEKARIYFEY